jgi:hypothetical protein
MEIPACAGMSGVIFHSPFRPPTSLPGRRVFSHAMLGMTTSRSMTSAIRSM